MKKIVEEARAHTFEMDDYFQKRTKRHIDLVQKYGKKIVKYPGMEGLSEQLKVHDASKYKEPEVDPYVWLTWRYKCQDDGVECKLPPGMEAKIKEATEHHILNNSHHPESHQGKKSGLLNSKDRDGIPDEMVDATKMPDVDIGEMVADWCGMSEERGNTPREWADKVVNKRWKFTDNQKDLIYKLIDHAWEGGK